MRFLRRRIPGGLLLHLCHALGHGPCKSLLVEHHPLSARKWTEFFGTFCLRDFSPEFEILFHPGAKSACIFK